MHIKLYFSILFLALFNHLMGQANCIKFEPLLEGKGLVLEQQIYLPSLNDSIGITQFKCYLSNLNFENSEGLTFTPEQVHHLLDASDHTSLTFALPAEFDPVKMSFSVGVDSLINEAGAQPGDLDPMHGMYWAWNTGYINFKLEGQSNICESRNNKLQWHIGGFLKPYNSQRFIELEMKEYKQGHVAIDLSRLIELTDLSVDHTIMSPSDKSMFVADQFSKIFYWDE